MTLIGFPLIVRIVHAAAVEGDDRVPNPQTRSLRRTAGLYAGHNKGVLKRLVRELETEFDGGRMVYPESVDQEPGIEEGGGREDDRQYPQRNVNPSRFAVI